jgi:hypothetical protein
MGFVGFDDCKISRLFQGGSGAITALIIKKDGFNFVIILIGLIIGQIKLPKSVLIK